MISEVSALLSDLQKGRVTRREFCKRALALGLSTSAAFALLESCDLPGSSTGTPVVKGGTGAISWESEADTYETFSYLAKKFSSLTPSVQVTQILGPSRSISPSKSSSSQPMLDDFSNTLQKSQKTPDILSLDVVWVSELASKQHWIVPLDNRWVAQERANYLAVPLAAGKYNSKIWAAPLHTDVGVLYYRQDIFPTPPQTWQELAAMSEQAMTSKKTRWGYVWQGAQYEGMLCNFVERCSPATVPASSTTPVIQKR